MAVIYEACDVQINTWPVNTRRVPAASGREAAVEDAAPSAAVGQEKRGLTYTRAVTLLDTFQILTGGWPA